MQRLSPETRGLAKDSFVLSIGSVVTMAGYLTQIVLVTHVLGLEQYGVLALAVAFVALVNGFFDVQVGDTAIAFASPELDRNPKRAAGVIQTAYLAELLTGVVAFAVVAALAPFFGSSLAGSQGPLLFFLTGLTLLGSTAETTSIAVLRLFGRFGSILRVIIVREVLRVGAVAVALATVGTLASVAVALVALETVAGLLFLLAAGSAFSAGSGRSLRRRSLAEARDARRPMIGMMFHTNIVTYAKLVQGQAPTLLLGAMRTPLDAGVFRLGMAVASAVAKPADPAWAAVMPRLSKLMSEGRSSEIRRMLKQATLIASAVIGLGAVVVFAVREPLLTLVGGHEAALASTVLALGLLARATNGILFWNTPVLYSARRAATAAKAYVAATALFAPLLVLFIDRWGANGAAGAILVFTIVLNLLLTKAALEVLGVSREQEQTR
jgi:O-antigen/teichoic acid export membrane protein